MEADKYNDKNFEDAFRQKFESFEEMPDDFLWDNISSQIEQKPTPFWKRFLPFLVFLPLILKPIYFDDDTTVVTTTQATAQTPISTLGPTHELQKETATTVVSSEEIIENQKTEVAESKSAPKTNTDLPTSKKATTTHKSSKSMIGHEDYTDNRKKVFAVTKPKIPVYIIKPDEPTEEEEEEIKNTNSEAKSFDITLKAFDFQPTILQQNLSLNLSLPSDQKTANFRERKTAYYAYLQPNYTLSLVTPKLNDGWLISEQDDNSDFNINNVGVSVGLGIEKSLSKRLNLGVGLEYSFIRKELKINYQSTTPIRLITSQNSSNSVSVRPVYEQENIDANIHAQQFNVNLSLAYQLNRTKSNYLIAGFQTGMITQFQIRPSDFMTLEKNEHFQSTISLGYEWQKKFSDKWSIGFAPQANYYFSSLLSDTSSISNRPYMIGFRLRIIRTNVRKSYFK